MTYDYFYGQQAEMFTFYRVPKVLFTEECFWNVSTDAKLLYGILLDRMNLSARNNWLDEEGRVYIIFTIEEIKGALGCAEKKAVKLLDELEKKCGLIERKRQGLGKPNLIYVKNFISGSVERQFLNCQKDNSGVVKNTIQELSKAQGNNTDTNYIDFSDTDPFFPSGFCGKEVDETDEFTRYYQYFYEQLSMDYLKQDYPYDHEILDLILHKSSLTTILDNPHYVGDTVLGRTLNAIYKGVKNQHIDREEWIVFPNTHEAIISREDFQKVREMRNAAAKTRVEKMERTEEIRATLINLFEDKIVCADCGRKLYFHRKRVDKRKDGAWYAFYECSSSVKRGNLCTPHYTRQDKLEADVLAAIQLQVKAALNYDKLLAKLRNSEGERSIRDQKNALITSLNLKLSGISKKRTRLYEDFTEGVLDEEEYAFAKKAYDEQYVDLSRRLDEAVQRKVKFAEAMSEDNKWLTLMKSVSGATMLSQELVDESVELVKVHEDGSIELVMKYGDIYALTVQSIKEVQEAM